jgi:stearoyl-CoA desaturase (delta-9 desaturase)
LSALRETLGRAHQRTTEVLKTLPLPHMPSREEFLREARARFAKTKSLDEIVDRAHELLLASIGRRLIAPMESR